jgi:hypothetical protein
MHWRILGTEAGWGAGVREREVTTLFSSRNILKIVFICNCVLSDCRIDALRSDAEGMATFLPNLLEMPHLPLELDFWRTVSAGLVE